MSQTTNARASEPQAVSPAIAIAPTIFALSSGHPPVGIAVIRISGAEAFSSLQSLGVTLPPPRQATLATFRHPLTSRTLDAGLVICFPAPASFTGEDVVELHLHGGRAVVASVLASLAALPGLRPAEAGAFTRRAFENGKLDLTAVEGLSDLIAAETESQQRQALAQADGLAARHYESWRTRLIAAQAQVEAALDFADEGDVGSDIAAEARAIVSALVAELTVQLADGHRGEILRDGFRVVLAGAPNAGKSSLMNALARREVAIVSQEAGTTRDVIEVRLDLGGLPVIVSDTAGIREAAGEIEREGIRRTYLQGERANLVLWLVDIIDPEVRIPEQLQASGAEVVPVLTKTDLLCGARQVAGLSPATMRISARRATGISDLERFIESRARKMLGGEEPALITRARHRQALEECVSALQRFLASPVVELELRAEDLRMAAGSLGRITGRVDVEDVLGEIFAGFCIGK